MSYSNVPGADCRGVKIRVKQVHQQNARDLEYNKFQIDIQTREIWFPKDKWKIKNKFTYTHILYHSELLCAAKYFNNRVMKL